MVEHENYKTTEKEHNKARSNNCYLLSNSCGCFDHLINAADHTTTEC